MGGAIGVMPETPGASGLSLAVGNVDAAAPPIQLSSVQEVQRELIKPSVNPDSAAYFITNFCYTMDEDAGNVVRLIGTLLADGSIGAKEFILRTIRTLDFKGPITCEPLEPANLLVLKSRRNLYTWIMAAYNVYCLHVDPNYSARIISKDQNSVDDSGHTNDSIFGRMRFIYDRLPDHIRIPIEFSHMRAQAMETNGYVRGGAPTSKAGRGTGPKRFFGDEFAYLEWAERIHQSADPACKHGKVYSSTANGPSNLFAKLRKKLPMGWRLLEVWWYQDPEKAVGLRQTVPGPERERYGPYISDWFVKATASLSNEDIAQEYGGNFQKSTRGLIHREFSRNIHVPQHRVLYDPTLPIGIGGDLGHARKTAMVITQAVSMLRLRVIGYYSGEFKNSPENANALVAYLRKLGYDGRIEDVEFSPDPSALNEEVGSGLSQVSWYRAVGFTQICLPRIQGPDSVMLGNSVVRMLFKQNMIEFDSVECDRNDDSLLEALESYKLPIDPATGDPRSNVPVHDMSSHPCDALRYRVTTIWTADDLPYEGFISMRSAANAPIGQRPEPERMDGRVQRAPVEHAQLDRDLFRSVASVKRVF